MSACCVLWRAKVMKMLPWAYQSWEREHFDIYEHNGNLWLAEILWGQTQAGFWHCVRLTQHLLNIRSGYLNLTRRGLRTLWVIVYMMRSWDYLKIRRRQAVSPDSSAKAHRWASWLLAVGEGRIHTTSSNDIIDLPLEYAETRALRCTP